MIMNKKTKIKLISIPIVLTLIFFIFAYKANYSTGLRSGVVIKVSKKGFFFKTLEGQINLESFGALKSKNNFSETFNFSIDKNNTDLINELREVSLNGELVNLLYHEKYFKLFWRGDTKFFVYEVERSSNPRTKDSKKSNNPF